ncbi:carbon-monoxide dehydrogenase medium subunit [Asanoa ferruginea]|uniref:Carbon-monoxide dehydrogenase medium subunit n=1 Tax=Asanoa ferruginea TaxID=53367 RepID=A0A3D9ZPC5_9ACTN|nr:xanthine dehydrogenase family protein subunit M [Asanoa ferruginea]REF98474.1 carbon-monoxide dehydrogenase medium subunit [Asanoa ferruginea]GIF52841.1 carbon monoxide dehydrogenase medium subunit [Asanoa ferruginea]
MQVPAPFTYERATSVEHAIELLGQLGPEARVVAGGHSLIPMMKLRLARPDALVDINALGAELGQIRVDGTDLVIGALTRHADLLRSAVAGEHFPIFHDAEKVIADPVVRNFGTVGGSLCQADPAEDLSAVFAAVDAVAVLRGPGGVRQVPVRELHIGPYETVLAPDELLIELRVRIRPGGGSAYEKVERRVGDYAVAAGGAAIWLDGDTVSGAGIGLTAVGAEHFAAPEAEAALVGQPATDESFRAAGRIAADNCNPTADQRGPVDYKRHLAAELTTRALRRAAARARGQEA